MPPLSRFAETLNLSKIAYNVAFGPLPETQLQVILIS